MNNNSACLLFTCKDRVGIIASLAKFFTDRNVSISQYEEYTDDGLFFSRLEWAVGANWKDESTFRKDFAEVAKMFDAKYRVHFFNRVQNLGLFVSKEPHALIEALNKQEADEFPNTNISFIIGNNEEAQKIADRHGIPFYYIKTSKNPLQHETEQLKIIKRYKPDFIGLARYMKILTADFLNKVGCPIINIHHSFLPSFVGAKPYDLAYERGVKLIGATSHFVTPKLDEGPIIEQDVTRVSPGCSVEDMRKMGRDIEKKVFVTALGKVLQHKTITYDNKTIVFN